jgi:hypothetical protein
MQYDMRHLAIHPSANDIAEPGEQQQCDGMQEEIEEVPKGLLACWQYQKQSSVKGFRDSCKACHICATIESL